MEIKIKNNNEYIPATLEVVDGVMIVSPVKDKVDITKFKDGDVVVYHYGEDASTIAVLQGEVDRISKYLFIEDYVSLDSVDGLLLNSNYTDSATWVRYATEEEKQKLFDALAKDGKAWDAEKKAVVELKWKPEYKEFYFRITFEHAVIIPHRAYWTDDICDKAYYQKGWCFKTKEECQAFCDRLNESISSIKP